jgi:hypothetical protein
MIFDSPYPSPAEFERLSGWLIKPEGACKDDRCVPLPPGAKGVVDLQQFAARLGMPVVHDEAAGLWSLGPEAGGRALRSAQAPGLALPDVHGRELRLDSLRGSKVLLVAWASW